MARVLLREWPVFAGQIARCDRLVRGLEGWSIVEALLGDGSLASGRVDRLQPVIFAIQVALGALLASEGCEPGAVVGHSLGEIAAAHLAGALSLEDAARVVVQYSKHQAATVGGCGMGVLELAPEQVERWLEGVEGLTVAAHNGPTSTVVSGDAAALSRLLERARGEGVPCSPVAADVAAHGPRMEAILPGLRGALAGVRPSEPRIPLASGLRGGWAREGDFGGDYFAENLRATVLFDGAIAALREAGGEVFVELGPHPVLARAMAQVLAGRGAEVLAAAERGDDAGQIRARLSRLRGLSRGARAVARPGLALDPAASVVDRALRGALRLPPGARCDLGASLLSLGLDSLGAMELLGLLEAEVGPLPEGFLRGRRSGAELAAALREAHCAVARPARSASGVLVSRVAPLSPEQARLWFLDRTLARKDTYHVYLPLRVEAALDEATLRRATEHVIGRHEQLRTSFFERQGQPVQRALPWVEPPLGRLDLSALDGEAREAELMAAGRALASAPFDLASAPLFRATLVDLGPGESALLLVFHHLIIDGWSIHVFLRDLDEAYRSIERGEEPSFGLALGYTELPAGPQGARQDALREWWTGELSGLSALDLGGGQGKSGAGRASFELSGELAAAIDRLARRAGCTPFVVLLSSFAALLGRVAGRDDLAVGTAVARRDAPGRGEVVGFLMNTVPVRCRLGGDPSFAELLGRVEGAVEGASSHADLPYDEIARQWPGHARGEELLGACLVLEARGWFNRTFAGGALRLAGSSASGDVEGTAKFGLTAAALPTASGYLISLEHSLEFLPEAAAAALGERLRHVLEQVTRDESLRLSSVDFVSPGERERDARLNDTARPLDARAAHEIFEERASGSPRAVALVEGERRLSFEALNACANRLARRLRGLGAGVGGRVGVCLKDPADQVVAMLAAAKAGAACVPLDPEYPAGRLSAIARDAGFSLLVADAGLVAPWAGVGRVDPADPTLALESPLDLGPTAGPRDALYVIYTSGSTGAPKGVEVEHQSLVNLIEWTRQTFGLGPGDRAAAVMSFGFDPAWWELWTCLCAGVELHLPGASARRSPGRYARYLVEHRITAAVLGANLAHLLVAQAPPAGLSLRVLFTGGEPVRLPPRGLPFEVVNTYGVTEATVVSTYARLRPGEGLAPIGRPIFNTSARVLGPGGDLALPGVAGELAVGGVGVARGYTGGGEAGRFVASPFGPGRMLLTGDRARLDPGGQLWFVGRLDDQIKLRGHRVELGEVEAAMAAHPAVVECTAAVREERAGDRLLVAYAVGRGGEAPGEEEMRAHCRGLLPRAMVPSRVVWLEVLPRTPHGKVDRGALPAPGAPALEAPGEDPVEREVCELFGQSLGLPTVGPRQDYFALGGHSLGLLELLGKIEQRWGREVSHAAFLEQPTAAGVAALLRGERGQEASALLVPLRTSGGRLPFFCATAGYGDLVSLRGLSRALGADQPFYALQAPRQGAASLEALAGEYAAAIRAVQPRGPYRLAGYSSGGLVAFEVARQLAEGGGEIQLLGLLDTPASFGPVQDLLYRGGRALLNRRLDLLMRVGSRLARVAHFLARDRGLEGYLNLLSSYRPSPFQGRITLFVPALSHHRFSLARRGWERLARGGLDVVVVEGDHESFIRPPYVEGLAAALHPRLAGGVAA